MNKNAAPTTYLSCEDNISEQEEITRIRDKAKTKVNTSLTKRELVKMKFQYMKKKMKDYEERQK